MCKIKTIKTIEDNVSDLDRELLYTIDYFNGLSNNDFGLVALSISRLQSLSNQKNERKKEEHRQLIKGK